MDTARPLQCGDWPPCLQVMEHALCSMGTDHRAYSAEVRGDRQQWDPKSAGHRAYELQVLRAGQDHGAAGVLDECDQDILKAALNGIDALLVRDFRPTSWKLQVLDLRSDAGTNFWHVWAGPGDEVSASPSCESGAAQPSPQRRRVGASCTKEETQHSAAAGVLVLLSDLCFTEPSPDELLTFLVKRVNEKKLLPQLCCRRLQFIFEPLRFHIIKKIFDKVHLDCVEEVEVHCHWEMKYITKFTEYLRKMVHLKSLYFGEASLHHWTHWEATAVFRHLEAPLESLGLTDSCITGSDLEYLSRCLSTGHLSKLHLRNVEMVGVDAGFLNILLERISGTLKELDLRGCGMTDTEFTAILPALGRCSQLDFLRFCGNSLSMDVLQSLLLRTVPQNKITMLEMPLPRECYVSCGGTRTIDRMTVRNWLYQLNQILGNLGLELDWLERDVYPEKNCISISFDFTL
ncbi:PREDICTED: PRAME family member 12-like [Elephantulus edwardii]|uniref:PRAME family member 12-like n=1 Tax=Elephantulus edwardii TaxID=28737 RepID=UPI0003F085FC|nr:PREDICTED: PRAME family member 12-like [Elephantulus edwardii]